MTLFDLGDPLPPRPEVSADVRRRLRQEELIAAGVHPIGGRRLLVGTSETCGKCRFRERGWWHNRVYAKCEKGPITHGAATDVKAKWPACVLFERADG
jgi:hypothetical protein